MFPSYSSEARKETDNVFVLWTAFQVQKYKSLYSKYFRLAFKETVPQKYSFFFYFFLISISELLAVDELSQEKQKGKWQVRGMAKVGNETASLSSHISAIKN